MSFIRTSQPDSSGHSAIPGFARRGTALLLCILLLSSCGPVLSFLDNDKSDQEKQAESANEPRNGQPPEQDGRSSSGGLAPLVPPGMDDRPPLPGQTGVQYTPDGLPALQPRGVNVQTLFAEDISDPIERIKRVENAVVEFRQEFDAVLPSIVRLVAVEQDIQGLVEQLQTLLQNEPLPLEPQELVEAEPIPPPQKQAAGMGSSAQPKPPVPQAQSPPVAEKPPVPLSVQASGGVQATGLRIGEHADKTRLVIDATGDVAYRHDLDNGEKLLIVELPGATWTGQKQWTSERAPLIASYTAQPLADGQGSRLIIQLKQEASVVYESALAGDGQNGRRIVLDLRSFAVHQ